MTTKHDMRPYCPQCDEQVSPQVVQSTKKSGPTMFFDTPGPGGVITHNTQTITSQYCSYCGTEVIPVSQCPNCQKLVLLRVEYCRTSGWSWDEFPLGFCSECDLQLTGDKKSPCFIATAAFGSPNAIEVEDLRHFRDAVLIPRRLGRSFVRGYYSISPSIAEWLKGRNFVSKLVRAALRFFLFFYRFAK